MTYPDGETTEGAWDITGSFDQYIGNYPIAGKSVLDVGTAGGFLAFEAERAGASVTALDALSASEFYRLHFSDSVYHLDRATDVSQTEDWLRKLRAGFWYSWNRYGSNVEMVYAPLSRLPYWGRKFDVVIAGAIVEHLADPVSVISDLAAMAREAVIIAFTPIIDSEAQFMEPANDWNNPQHNFTFWTLSCGLYRRIFANVGYFVEFVPAKARFAGREWIRPTIIARKAATAAAVSAVSDQDHGAIDSEIAKSCFLPSMAQEPLDRGYRRSGDAAKAECVPRLSQSGTPQRQSVPRLSQSGTPQRQSVPRLSQSGTPQRRRSRHCEARLPGL